MKTSNKNLTRGFTIIEVLIVLAIAGLIMAIVFLAVPALQRNSRNSQIRSDAANVLAGVNEYIANNNGQLPNAASCPAQCPSGNVTISGTGNSVTAKVRGGTTVGSQVLTSGSAPISTAPNTVQVYFQAQCSTTVPVTATYTARSVAAGFAVEGATATIPQCIAS